MLVTMRMSTRLLVASAAGLTALGLVTGCSQGGGSDVSPAAQAVATPSASATPDAGPGATSSGTPSPEATASAETPSAKKSVAAASPGKKHKRSTPRRAERGIQVSVLENLPGTTTSNCVVVGKHRDVRSGTFAAGPFDDARRSYDENDLQRREVRLYFVPVHSRTMPGLQLTVTDRATGDEFTVSQETWGRTDNLRYYNSYVTFPHAGTWTITATAGKDQGCWIATLG